MRDDSALEYAAGLADPNLVSSAEGDRDDTARAQRYIKAVIKNSSSGSSHRSVTKSAGTGRFVTQTSRTARRHIKG